MVKWKLYKFTSSIIYHSNDGHIVFDFSPSINVAIHSLNYYEFRDIKWFQQKIINKNLTAKKILKESRFFESCLGHWQASATMCVNWDSIKMLRCQKVHHKFTLNVETCCVVQVKTIFRFKWKNFVNKSCILMLITSILIANTMNSKRFLLFSEVLNNWKP